MTEIPLRRGYAAVIDDEHADVAGGYRWIRLSKTTAIEHGVASARCRPFGTGSTRR